MNLLNRQGPVAQVLEYISKLALFLAVPGIHLAASGKKALGYTIIFLVIFDVLIFVLVPADTSYQEFWISFILVQILKLLMLISIIFLVFDLRMIGRRKIRRSLLVTAFVILSVFFWPYATEEIPFDVNIEPGDQMCPAICNGDIVVFKMVDEDEAIRPRIGINDIIIVAFDGFRSAARIQAIPGQIVCTLNGARITFVTKIPSLCPQFVELKHNEYYVAGDLSELSGKIWQYEHGAINRNRIIGIEPLIVANWSGFFRFLAEILYPIFELATAETN